MTERELFRQVAEHAADFVETLDERPIRAEADVESLTAALGGPLPENGAAAEDVVASLVEAVDPGLVGIPSGRYFGFVIGGGVPAAVAADMLASVWDQNAGLYAAGPAASVVEEVCRGWLAELLALPADVSVAYVTGCQMAHVTALAAARHHVLAQAPGGTSRRTGSPAGRRSASSSARSATSPSTARCGCSASARRRSSSSTRTTRDGCASTRCARRSRPAPARRSCARRPAR